MQRILRSKTLDFIQDDVFGRFNPSAELSVGPESAGKVNQIVQIEVPVNDAGSVLFCIEGIAFLFDMGRNHHDRLPQIHGLADRLEPRCAGISLASRHLTQELHVIKLVKRKRAVYFLHRFFFPMIPKEAERHLWMNLVPLHNAFRKARIDHIPVNIVALSAFLTEHIRTQQRGNNRDMPFCVFVHRTERKSQPVGCSQRSHLRKKVQEKKAETVGLGKLEILM